MNNVVFILTGESASGKSSVQNYMVENLGFKRIVTYTTRPPRENEVDGLDYYFITKSHFLKLKEQGFFAETAYYNGWYYGSAKKDYYSDNFTKVAVLTPHGIRQIERNLDDVITYITYLKVPRRDRLIKILQRGDDIEEAYRRNLSDVGQFDGIEDEVDLIIENNGYERHVSKIAIEIIT